MNYTIIPVTSNLFGLLDSRGSQWKATKLSATHVIFPFTLMHAIDELPEGVVYEPQMITLPELVEGEGHDYAAIYASIDWSGCVELPIDIYRAFVSNELGQDVIYTAQEPVSVEVAVPQVITRFQAKAALLQAGLLQQVDDYMKTADAITQLAWQEAEFHRDSNLISTTGSLLGLTEEQINELFITASMIEI